MIAFGLLLALHVPQAPNSGQDLPRRGALGLPFSPIPADVVTKLKLKAGEGLLAGSRWLA